MTYTTSSGKSVIKLTLVVLQILTHCLPVIYTIHSYSHFDASTPVRIVFHNIWICCACSFWWLTLHNYNFSQYRRHWQTRKFYITLFSKEWEIVCIAETQTMSRQNGWDTNNACVKYLCLNASFVTNIMIFRFWVASTEWDQKSVCEIPSDYWDSSFESPEWMSQLNNAYYMKCYMEIELTIDWDPKFCVARMSEIKKRHQHEILNGYEFQSMSNQNEWVNTACELLKTVITDSQSQLLRFKILNGKNEWDINGMCLWNTRYCFCHWDSNLFSCQINLCCSSTSAALVTRVGG